MTSERAQLHHPQADIILSLIEARFGRSFADDERTRLRADLIATLDRTASLRTIRLENGDEPMPLFSVEAFGGAR